MRGTAVWRVMRVRALDFVLPSRSAKSLGRKKKWRHFVTKKRKMELYSYEEEKIHTWRRFRFRLVKLN